MAIDFCPKCCGAVDFIAGCPAHDSNLYCIDKSCGWQAWDKISANKRLHRIAVEIESRVQELCPSECYTAKNKEHAEMVANEMMDNCVRLIAAIRQNDILC